MTESAAMQALIDLFGTQMLALTYASARTLPVFLLLPCLGDRILPGATVRASLVLWTVLGLGVEASKPAADLPLLAFALLRETGIGVLVALPLCLPFWVAQAIGELLDNQRGATLAESIDPASGHEASTLAAFLGMWSSAIFFARDGMQIVLRALQRSYAVWPLQDIASVSAVLALLAALLGEGLKLAAPVVLVMLLADAVLGVYSRFCPQVNAFSLSLSIKTVLALIVMLPYLGTTLATKIWALWFSGPASAFLAP